MADRSCVVLDVGKTHSKLSLWSADGRVLERRTRVNPRLNSGPYFALDAAGIEQWLAATLREFACLTPIGWIVPVAHGAAAAILRDGHLASQPFDYESPIPGATRAAYDLERDPFLLTGSPALPDGLNLGAQLAYLSELDPTLLRDAVLLPWPQYWSWVLSGVAAAEVTSLGCHTDLWRPLSSRPSELAVRRGWANILPPLRLAGEVLGSITPEWAGRTGLPRDTQILCGLHDSNAALLAARGCPELAGREATVLSTGTWFIAMRTPVGRNEIDASHLSEERDCLINVDCFGAPVPSSRFMGGREFELLGGTAVSHPAFCPEMALLPALTQILNKRAMVLPTFTPGTGPFPAGRGRWIDKPANPIEKLAAICLYTALIADASIELIGTRERLLVDGRFADSEVFVRALAALRPDMAIYRGSASSEVALGALRLLDPNRDVDSPLSRVEPLEADLHAYREHWREEVRALTEQPL